MTIIPYQPDMLDAVVALYNKTVDGVPHCHPVTAELFCSQFERFGYNHTEPASLEPCRLLVASEAGQLLGFVHAGVSGPTKEKPVRHGVIRFLTYTRGCRRAGQALLQAAEDLARQAGAESILAFFDEHRYPFYHLRYGRLSQRMDHVESLLRMNGYRTHTGEIYLDWPDFEPRPPVSPPPGVEISVEWRPGKGRRPGVHLTALQDGKAIGHSDCISLSDVTCAPDAADWLMVIWVGVFNEHQGRSLGLHLLQRALVEMHGIGYRHAVISTAIQNYRAQLFYSNHGFRVVDYTHTLERGLV